MLHAKNLTLTYPDGNETITAVNNISLTIEDYQFVGILGPSGSGKSSLLYLLSGMKQPSSGDVLIDDRAYSKLNEADRIELRRTTFGFVFQQQFLIDYLTVLENVMVAAVGEKEAQVAQARALLADLGLAKKLHRYPHQLSGGERQRVAVARAAIHRPRVIFADEPTGLLDRHSGLQVISLLRSVTTHGSLVAVTHNPEILSEADLILTLREGRIVKVDDRVSRQKEVVS
ncbi:MAG: ABC transporter ATP-binding protein [Chloroflexota bacterium]